MKTFSMSLKEIYMDDSARWACPSGPIPVSGQYLLADFGAADSPLAFPLFSKESTPQGFISAPTAELRRWRWQPGDVLSVRGPLGRGFSLPISARKVVLFPYLNSSARLYGIIPLALKRGAEVALVASAPQFGIPEAVEVQPIPALVDVLRWADYLALDAAREDLPQLKTLLAGMVLPPAQILVRAPMPCGGVAECGVCALPAKRSWRMICKEGPVFDWGEL